MVKSRKIKTAMQSILNCRKEAFYQLVINEMENIHYRMIRTLPVQWNQKKNYVTVILTISGFEK
jgi:hypothetical protein